MGWRNQKRNLGNSLETNENVNAIYQNGWDAAREEARVYIVYK